MKATLNKRTRTLDTPNGVWAIEAIHIRAGGDRDVVLAFASDEGKVVFSAYRHTSGVWRRLNAGWMSTPPKPGDVAGIDRYAVIEDAYLTSLLDLALPSRNHPDPSAAYKAALEDQNDETGNAK